MIKNDRQLQVTLRQRELLASGASSLRKTADSAATGLRLAALEADIARLDREVETYRLAAAGEASVEALDLIENAGEQLIHARIAAGLTQKQLADLLDTKEQQIQRYERGHYRTANLNTLSRVAGVLLSRLPRRSARKRRAVS